MNPVAPYDESYGIIKKSKNTVHNTHIPMKYIGLDAGSVSVKAVVLDEKGSRLENFYVRHKGHPLNVALDMLKSILSTKKRSSEDRHYSLSLTGSAGRLLGTVLSIDPINEVVA